MGKTKNRRAESDARSLAKHTDIMLARASAALLEGNGLEATRLIRAAETLNELDSRLRSQRAWQARTRQDFDAAQRDLARRERVCLQREHLLDLCDHELRARQAQHAETEAAVSAAYALMYGAECDGLARAIGELTDPGVAPI
ncbi:MAG: hypothetical protein JNL81_16645 [Hyphomonadaceae bacterium]|nr:hypothetical protein [Hyphomonadaceae bacterium]